MLHLCCFIIVLVALQSLLIGKTEAAVEVYEIYVETLTFAHDHTGLIVVPGQRFGHVKAVVAPTWEDKNSTIARILKAKGIALVKGEQLNGESYMVVPRYMANTFKEITVSRYVYSVTDGISKKELNDASPKIRLSVENYALGLGDFKFAASKITQKSLEFTNKKLFGEWKMTFGSFEPGKFSMAKSEDLPGGVESQQNKLFEFGGKYVGQEFTPTFETPENIGTISQTHPVLRLVKCKITGFSVKVEQAKTLEINRTQSTGAEKSPTKSAAEVDKFKYTLDFKYEPTATAA